ncbi:MAG: lamin tail domain-containing protein [Sedimentisphaerales bacterium]|nr:lamin tail domain-containing protein [Sedimentisphaerales bacterium]
MNKQSQKSRRINMKARISLVIMLALAIMLPVATMIVAAQAGAGRSVPPRPEGPGDIYAAGGCPLVAAHSTTRALYASYNGPLYEVMRQSDGQKLDIGVVQPSAGDAGGYANAAAQDAFCANTYCWITTIYDQSGKKNHLVQAPRGGFSGPAMGGFNNIPLADWAPVTIMGHKAYGVFIAPGMGLRQNDAHGTAVDDQAEGQYWVISGHHFNGGCCYDYGNGETDSRDDGDGTMETTYFGTATAWYRGPAPGPWIMSDQENNLVGCVTDSPNNKFCPDLPIISWRFVAATMDGEPHHWRTMGGDAQKGDMKVQFDGPRVQNPNNTYDPMRKQGAILLGNGGDNSNGSQGSFYEGAMTAANTMPTQELNQKIQANIVAAKYEVPRLSIAPASAAATPPGLQTFSPDSSQDTTVTFTNTTGAPATGLKLSISVPTGWSSFVSGSTETSKTFTEPVAPGATVIATFKVTSGSAAFNGDIVSNASWTNSSGQTHSEKMAEKVRNVSPIKINEFANSFIELYNAGDSAVDISNWTLTQHPTQQPIFSSVKIPSGTKLAAKGFYVLGLSNSGLAVPAQKGDTTIHVRSMTGMNVGDTIEIGTGSAMEIRRIESIRTPTPAAAPGGRGGRGGGPGGGPTTVWQPLPEGPVITIPVGSTNVPVTSVAGFEVGQKMAIGYGATYPTAANTVEKYEVVTVTAVGKPGTQAWTSVDTKPGDTNIKVSSVANISPGEKIRFGYDTVDHGVEWVTVKNVGTQSAFNPNYPERSTNRDGGTGLDLAEPLKFHHSANTPFSARGTGISFEPATKFAHSSNEPVLPLSTYITLDKALDNNHEINAAVRNEKVTTDGYQGKPNQWFGGPAISNAGNMVLRDAAGLVADSLNFGGVIDPWASEGYQAVSPGSGCSAPAPSAGGGGGRGGMTAGTASRSTGRFPDGTDTDSNCNDFLVQTAGITMSASSAAGSNNIKVDSVSGLSAGQTINIDSGENRESAVIATVGTAGSTTVGTATEVGAIVIPVASATGFSTGQTISIDSGGNSETAVVASVSGGRTGRGGGMGGARGERGGARGGAGGVTITVTAPLKFAHAAGVQVSGSGITFTTALAKAHAIGAQVGGTGPTPGAANQYSRSSQGGRRGN